MINFHLTPVPHDEAAKLIEGKAIVTRDIFDRMPEEIQARAFVVPGIESHDVLQSLRDRIAELPRGADWDEVKKDVVADLSPHMSLESANRRASILMRHHGFSAYASAQAQAQDALIDVFPFRQYLSTDDHVVRPTHAALNGIVLPADHPFWLNHTPPWEWNCRCDVVELTEIDAEEEKARDRRRNPENKRVLEGAALTQLELGNLNRGPNVIVDVRTAKEKGGNYENNVRDLSLPYDDIKKRWTPDVREAFEAWAAETEIGEIGTIMDWLLEREPTVKKLPTLPSNPIPPLDLAAARLKLAKIQLQIEAVDLSQRALTLEDRHRLMDEVSRKIEEARKVVEIPAAKRGKMSLQGTYVDRLGKTKKTSAPIMKKAREGAAICERYTHPDFLPQLTVRANRGRAFHLGSERAIYVGSKTSASVMAHEITHGTEQQTASVLKKSLAFLDKRAAGEKPQRLRDLTGLGYGPGEVTFEDGWENLGGDHYCGKDYGGRATELLTMGIERLDRNPAAFAKEDPEYFDFVISTLQIKDQS
jgi:SPP1 gp7 family putative phage head morphogenesis protein